MKGLKFYDAFLLSRSLNGWSGPIIDPLYLQYMDEETFTFSKVGGYPRDPSYRRPATRRAVLPA